MRENISVLIKISQELKLISFIRKYLCYLLLFMYGHFISRGVQDPMNDEKCKKKCVYIIINSFLRRGTDVSIMGSSAIAQKETSISQKRGKLTRGYVP